VRRLAELLRGPFGEGRTLELTASDMRQGSSDPARGEAPGSGRTDQRKLDQLARGIGEVADYVARLKREISTLKAGEVSSKRIPETVTDLKSVHAATKGAADAIMAAAEAIIALNPSDPSYPDLVMARVTEIMEACSFEDLTGQRLDRAMGTLHEVEERLERFAKAVKIADAAERFDRKAIAREARRQVLLVEGPQDRGVAIEQSAIDKLFD
jgi:chemotaxis protein CheZ